MTFTFVVTHTGDYGDVVTNTVEYSHTTGSDSAQAVFSVEGPPNVGTKTFVYMPIILRDAVP